MAAQVQFPLQALYIDGLKKTRAKVALDFQRRGNNLYSQKMGFLEQGMHDAGLLRGIGTLNPAGWLCHSREAAYDGTPSRRFADFAFIQCAGRWAEPQWRKRGVVGVSCREVYQTRRRTAIVRQSGYLPRAAHQARECTRRRGNQQKRIRSKESSAPSATSS